MKVILNKDVPQLGDEGDIKNVAAGYARNYLMPNNLAMPFSKHGLVILEQKKAKIEANKIAKKELAMTLKEKLQGYVMELRMPAGVNGKLFGAVNNSLISDKLKEAGLEIERKQIGVPQNSIKILGEFDVKIKLLEKEIAFIRVIVKPETDEKSKAKTEEEKVPYKNEFEDEEEFADSSDESNTASEDEKSTNESEEVSPEEPVVE